MKNNPGRCLSSLNGRYGTGHVR